MQYSERQLVGPVAPDCKHCPLDGCTQVFPAGQVPASIALVGEGPGQNEIRRGVPFIGQAGEMLDWLLDKAGVARRNLYITNAALCMPRRRVFQKHTEYEVSFTRIQTLKTSTQDTCRERLLSELNVVKPRVVLAVGGYALQSLTGKDGILKRHGALMPVDHGWGPTTVIPCLHPAGLLRKPSNAYAVIQVLKKASRIAQGWVQPPSDLITISPYMPGGPDAACDYLDFLVQQALCDGVDIGVDVETNTAMAREAFLSVVGWGSALRNHGVAVTVRIWNRAEQRYEPAWSVEHAQRIYAALNRLLCSNLPKWYWNAGFDTTILERDFPDTKAYRHTIRDGIHQHWLTQPEMDHNLAFAAQQVLDIPPWKADFWEKQNAGEATHEDLLRYNAEDNIYTIRGAEFFKQQCRDRGNEHLVEHQMRVAKLSWRAENYGIPIDVETWAKLHLEYRSKQQSALALMRDGIRGHEEELSDYVQKCREEDAVERSKKTGKYNQPTRWELTADAFNPRSPLQARWFLFEFLNLTPKRMTAGGEDAANKRASASYKGVLGYLSKPLVKAYVDYSEYIYKVGMLEGVRRKCEYEGGTHARLYVSWNATSMKGTRWVSKIVNMQNWEKAMRRVLKALPGRVWVGADAAQIEYRVAACLANLEELIALFNQEPFDEEAEPWKKYDEQYDAHSLVACEVYGDAYREPAQTLAKWMPWVCQRLGIEPRQWKKRAKHLVKAARDDILTARFKEVGKALGILGPWRTVIKRVVYALFYGAHPERILTALQEDRRLSSDLRASLKLSRIEEIWHGFKARWPEWDRWAAQEMHYAMTRGYQEFPPLGRKRWWTAPTVEENKIRNTPIQLSAGDICNIIFCNIQDRIDAEGLDALMTIHGHDALFLDTADKDAKRVKEIVNEEFHCWLPGPGGPVHIYGQASIGPTVADVG